MVGSDGPGLMSMYYHENISSTRLHLPRVNHLGSVPPASAHETGVPTRRRAWACRRATRMATGRHSLLLCRHATAVPTHLAGRAGTAEVCRHPRAVCRYAGVSTQLRSRADTPACRHTLAAVPARLGRAGTPGEPCRHASVPTHACSRADTPRPCRHAMGAVPTRQRADTALRRADTHEPR